MMSFIKVTVCVCTLAILLAFIPDKVIESVIYILNPLTVFRMSSTLSTWYIIISSLGIYHSSSPVVETDLGSIQGIISSSRNGKEFYEYRGIPFAKPPIGDLRFEAPLPAEPWEGVRDGGKFSSACMQFDAIVKGIILGMEKINPEKPLAVIAYIHGGGFTGGESMQFDPKYWMDDQVVLVTFNYRLASLGFLNTGDELIRGNMGLKDQNMALRWIQRNVANFGGDRNSVTLIGESAGAASVHYHIISPLSRGLFHNSVLQSGNVACPWAFTRSPQHQALRYGKILNCPTENTTILVDCLKKMDAKDIVKHHVKIMSPVHLQDDFFPGSVEAVKRDDTFLAENPFDMLERGDFAHIPVIISVNSGEGGLKLARLESYSEILNELDQKWNEHVPVLMHYDPNRTDVSDHLRNYYLSPSLLKSKVENEDLQSTTADSLAIPRNASDNVRVNPAEHLELLSKMLSDGLFFEANHKVAKYHSKYAPTYLYYYTYRSDTLPSAYAMIRAARPKKWYPWEVNIVGGAATYYVDKYIWSSKDPKRFGSCHGDDLLQLWSFSLITDIRPSSSDYTFSKNFVDSIVSFANNESELKFNDVLWPSVNSSNEILPYMKLDRIPIVIDEPFIDGVRFIQSLNIRDPKEKNNW